MIHHNAGAMVLPATGPRLARQADVSALARVINRAYEIERFFVDRPSDERGGGGRAPRPTRMRSFSSWTTAPRAASWRERSTSRSAATAATSRCSLSIRAPGQRPRPPARDCGRRALPRRGVHVHRHRGREPADRAAGVLREVRVRSVRHGAVSFRRAAVPQRASRHDDQAARPSLVGRCSSAILPSRSPPNGSNRARRSAHLSVPHSRSI